MHESLIPIASLYESSHTLFLKATADVTREQGLARVGPEANPLLWIAAHLATTRCGVAQIAGLDHARPWGRRFTRGTHVEDLAALPQMDEIRSAWGAVTEALAARLPHLTEAELAAPAPRDFPIRDKTVRGALGFLAYHEAYHIGQMALIRKALGLGSLIG